MRLKHLATAVIAAATLLAAHGMAPGTAAAQEQLGSCNGNCGGAGCDTGTCIPQRSPWESYSDTASRNADGSMIANCIQGPGCRQRAYPSPAQVLRYAKRDRFHPYPVYAYGRAGIDATRIHTWNYNQAAQYPWHGNYYHRQYGQPLAMVVPPTAAYQTEYNWGVANTKSLPIYHQFAKPEPGGPGGGTFSATPYWPSSTNQFGIYPVRGSW